MRRRDFLVGGAALLGAVPAVGRAAAPDGGGSWLERVQRDFPHLDRSKVQMAGFLLATHPRPVQDAIEQHRRALDRDTIAYLYAHNVPLMAAVREAAGRYLGVRPRHVALTDSTTLGLGLVYGAIAVRPDQELLATTHDHHATLAPLRLRAERTGAAFRQVDLYEEPSEATAEEITRRVREAIRPETRVLAVTWVHSGTGVRLPLPALAEVVATANRGRSEDDRILLCVDGVHGLGVEPVALPDVGCDVFVSGTHKWLFGPRGTGLLWANRHGRAALRPIVASFTAGEGWGGAMTPGGFHSFEHRWALAQALDWHASLDRELVRDHIHAMARRIKEGLAAIPGVRLVTPMADDLSSGIACFDVARERSSDTTSRLWDRGVVSMHAPYARSHARLAPAVYTTPDEVDRALEAVEAIA